MKIDVNFLFLALFPVLMLAGCSGSSKDKKERLLQEEVMVIHDEVMPKMGNIEKLSQKLDSVQQSRKKKGEISDSAEKEIEARIQALSEASKAMMQWMRKYNKPSDTMKHQEVMEYLEKEKEKIIDVKNQINTSIQKAEEALAKNE